MMPWCGWLYCWRSPPAASDIPLTGDPDADADILAFVHARQRLAHRGTGISVGWLNKPTSSSGGGSRSDTVEPLILVALNFGVQVH